MIPQTTLEIEAFRLPLTAAVAAKIDVFGFGPQSEDDLRNAIRSKDSTILSLMHDYFAKLIEKTLATGKGECGDTFWKLIAACESARLELVKRTSSILE